MTGRPLAPSETDERSTHPGRAATNHHLLPRPPSTQTSEHPIQVCPIRLSDDEPPVNGDGIKHPARTRPEVPALFIDGVPADQVSGRPARLGGLDHALVGPREAVAGGINGDLLDDLVEQAVLARAGRADKEHSR